MSAGHVWAVVTVMTGAGALQHPQASAGPLRMRLAHIVWVAGNVRTCATRGVSGCIWLDARRACAPV
jgi:hypothetical protein